MRESSGIAPGLVSLPSAGTGAAPLGDRFEPDLVRGSGTYTVSINTPRGPNDQRPSLVLGYSTGSGNGPFGVGWRLNVMRIERQSDRGVPRYSDSDVFVIGDAEVLVPVGGNRYRPHTETKFWDIERLDDSWRIRAGDGRTLFFGRDAASREQEGARVFAWYLDEERDAAGNSIVYRYMRDGNRLYLSEVSYSIFRVRIVHESRPDVLRSGRSGFERATAKRGKAIELHCRRLAPTLMWTYELVYESAVNGASLLKRISLSSPQGDPRSAVPKLTFEYSSLNATQVTVHDIESAVMPPPPEDARVQLVDMTGDGLPDILQSFGSRMLLWRNAGEGAWKGRRCWPAFRPWSVSIGRTWPLRISTTTDVSMCLPRISLCRWRSKPTARVPFGPTPSFSVPARI